MTLTDLQGRLAALHPDTLTGALVLLVVFVVAGLILSALVRHAIRLLLDRDREGRVDRMAATFLSRIAAAFVWVLVMILYAHMIPVLDRLGTALLASVSVASIVIGLAAQSTLANIVAGLSLVFHRPFRLGDRIQVTAPTGLETGTVEDVSLGYTVIRTFDNRRVIVANAVLSNAIMVNLTAVDARVMAVVPFQIGYDEDIEAARRLILAEAEAHDAIDEIVGCPVVSLGPSGVNLSLRAWCADAALAMTVTYDLTERVKSRFDVAGIEIPYPYQNVLLRSALVSAEEGEADEEGQDDREEEAEDDGEQRLGRRE